MLVGELLLFSLSFFFVMSQDLSELQTKAEEKIKIRIRDGPTISEGRIEVLHDGEWGTICDDDWDLNAAQVACRMMGFEGALDFAHSGKYGPGEGLIQLDNVHCDGEEKSLHECEHRGLGVSDCSHHEDAGVKCSPKKLPDYLTKQWFAASASFDRMRLKPPRGMKKRLPQIFGYVEIFHDEKWRHICTDGWKKENARVICGQLGFPDASDIGHMYSYLTGKKQKHRNHWLTNLTCTGEETKLVECDYGLLNYTASESCATGEAALIRCTPGDSYTLSAIKKSIRNQKGGRHHVPQRYTKPHELIRLKSGSTVGEGRLEVMRNGRWGTVCHSYFDIRDATVACRQLGFGTAKRVYPDAYFGMAHGPIWMTNLNCNGNETNLEDCKHDKISEHYTGYGGVNDGCTHTQEVAIACHVPDLNIQRRIRIVGGRNPLEGRVEVQIGKKWGPICSDMWTAKEAMVACRQLGMGYALHALKEVWYYPGSDDASSLMMTGVECKGDEIGIQYCHHDGKKLRKCGDSKRTMTPFAGVICTEGSPDLITDIPMLSDSIHMEDRGLSNLICAAEEKCLSSSADELDMRTSYGHRRLLRFSSRVWNRGRADFRPARLPNDWEWHSCHGHFHSMAEFTHYDILSLNKTRVAEGHKASFCLEDTHCDDGVSRRYDCDQPGGGTQGITVGCSDTYLYNIDCQWIDITDLPGGNYLFRVHVNPNHLVPESDFSNNEVICNMRYDGQQVWVWNCHIGTDFDPTITANFYTENMFP
ncbi:lysyl oxidase homolog 2A-like isoform X1 [Styela clava]